MELIILALILGCLAGVITGLTPGIHTNTIAIITISGVAFLLKFFSKLEVGIFLVSMVIVHSFIDFIPSIFLGAPEAETALSILPGHQMLMQGEGYKALVLTVIGGIGAFLIGLAIIPFFFLFLKNAYPYLSKAIVPIILIFSIAFILIEKSLKKKIWALLVFLLSGVLGIIVLNLIEIPNPLFPLLTGLFGTSTLIVSYVSAKTIAQQNLDVNIKIFTKSKFLNYLKASFSSIIVSILPAIGAAQATIIAQGFVRLKNHEDYLIIIGGINTVSSLFVLTTLYLVDKARTGVMASLQEIITLDFSSYLVLLATCFVAAGIGIALTLIIGKHLANKIWKYNYQNLNLIIITFLLALSIIFSGLTGFLVILIATSIGLLAPLAGIRRIHAMSCLILSVVFYYI